MKKITSLLILMMAIAISGFVSAQTLPDPPTSLSGVATHPTIIELDWEQNADGNVCIAGVF